MPRKIDVVSETYNRISKKVVSTPEEWQKFLSSACRNYKLRFDEQLLVYSEKPNATAVLEIEDWNGIFGRWVNKGAKGVPVLEDLGKTKQRIKYYFDISDTHENKRSRPVPIWQFKEEYTDAVIETLENTFGELQYKDTLIEAIVSASENATEDNLVDYVHDLMQTKEGSLLEGLDALHTEAVLDIAVTNSVAYMIMARLGINPNEYFDLEDFRGVVNFTTKYTLEALGAASNEIAETALTPIARTIMSLEKDNRIIADTEKDRYNEDRKTKERSDNNERVNLQQTGRLPSSQLNFTSSAGTQHRNVWQEEAGVLEETPQGKILQFTDRREVGGTSERRGSQSEGDGRNPNEADSSAGRRDGETQSRGYDELGKEDEQHQEPSSGNRSSGDSVRIDFYDREHEDKSLPFFGRTDDIHEILLTTPHLKASRAEIKSFLETKPDSSVLTEYIKGVFNNEPTELTLKDGRTVGYKTYQNVLHLWEGTSDSKTAQSFFDWRVIADNFEGLRLIGRLEDNAKALPSLESQTESITSNAEKTNSAFVFSQEIIDTILTRGSSIAEGKMRIYDQFEKSLSSKENAEFLKNEYGWGGAYPVISGTNIDEQHDAKGICISNGLGEDAEKLLLTWSQVEKRISDLIKMDRYLNPKEKEAYPQWLQKEEEKRILNEEYRKNREILSTAPTEKETEMVYEYHLGDKAYIGSNEFEILSFDDERVMLYDSSFPLIHQEMSREEFDAKVRENPYNDHLKVEKKEVISEVNEAVEEPIVELEEQNDEDLLIQKAKDILSEYNHNEFQTDEDLDFSDLSYIEVAYTTTEDENHELQAIVNLTDNQFEGYVDGELKTTIKFHNLEDLVENGLSEIDFDEFIHIAESEIEEEKIIEPSFEKPKIRSAQSFDIHPNVPMAERVNFNFAENPVEAVPKKERFRRNIEAINVLKTCELEDRFATPEEQLILSKYVGWGGMPEAFDENNQSWASEFTELYTVLSPEEYAAAKESTLTAFYTPPEVITAVYKVMEHMRFKQGNILEPSCGIGNFIGMVPSSMKESKFYGVELDKISAGIAQQLYQKSSIAPQGYEETNLPDSFFDAVIGNVPFGDFKVVDKRYDKHKFLIHDYFFAKSLDKLRPGGVMALITSKGTMDKENSAVRKYIAQRADLIGAIRLPNDTFKSNAGTEVVSDILILQKRDRIVDIEPSWVQLGVDEKGRKMNSYFVEHPEMVLGEWKTVSGRFGNEDTVVPYEGLELSDLLEEAVSDIHGEINAYEQVEELGEEDDSIPADPNVRNFSFTVVDDKIYFRENSRMVPAVITATAENRIKGMIKIRDCVRNLIELQTEDFPDEDIKTQQETLNSLYDSFTKKYGLLSDRANRNAFSDDSSYCLLSALEVVDENGKLERKADMFTKRTIKPHIPITSVDTASEALAVSLGEKAKVDMEYMCSLTGKTEEQICSDLKGVIFLNPMYGYGDVTESKYLSADEYLSGNVREKLITAKKSAEVYPEQYAINVEALQKVQPKDLSASEISVRLGATWIPPEIVEQFVFELLQTPRYAQWNIRVHFSKYNGEWNVEGKNFDRSNVNAYSTYGTGRINAYKIIEETLNLKDVRIVDYVEDNEGKKKAVLNKKETAIAQAKQEDIKQKFKDWIWTDPERRETLTKIYNERFNSIRPREYDGSHIEFSGKNPEIELREHQKNAVAHILYGGNTLLAHAVGAGKTFEMAAAAMESKRLGLCNKSLFVVPNHLTEQWASEFLQLYPSANILVATKKDFEMKNRKKFCGRIATGDYDAVIIGHSQFEKIPMSIERQKAILQQQLDEVIEGIADLKRNRGDNFSVKQLEKTKKSLKVKLEKLNDQSRKDDVVTFEELGVDRIFVDESHYYKNLFLYTKMRNVGGIAQTEAQKSSDLFMKCRYLDELTGGRGTVFATGTPISNSMVELYTIQRYLQYNTLQKYGLQHFDAWASTFGETVTAVELTPEGTGYRAKTRFAKFYNLPELMSMFKEVADIKTPDMLHLPVPNAHYHNVAVKPSQIQKDLVASLSDRADKVRNGTVDSTVDNMLLITNDGRKLALDQRLTNDMLPDFEGSKVNACVDNIVRIWEETSEKKSAQLVFCDLSTPKNDGTFSVYDDIRKKLIERGIPAEEVKFIHEADTEAKKKELFNKVRKGEVRVLMGSTQKMGAGTNVQDKLVALHDIDCPWRPSDLEQRSGRIIRQGNENSDVDIYRYVTEETFDAYLYQLVEGKQKFASQIMTSKSPVRSAEDIDETALSYAEIKMLATGNPYIKEKMDLDIQVQKLRLLKSNYLNEKYALEDKIIKYYPQEIARRTDSIEDLKKDIECVEKHPKPTDDKFVGMKVKGALFTEKADAGKAILEACRQMTSPNPIPLGEYRGFGMELLFDTIGRNYVIEIKGELSYSVPLGSDVHGNITRLDNVLDSFSKKLEVAVAALENTKQQMETAKESVKKPFADESKLEQMTARLNELNILLDMDKNENEIVGGEVSDEGKVVSGKDKFLDR